MEKSFRNKGPGTLHIKPRKGGTSYHEFNPGDVVEALDAEEEKILAGHHQVERAEQPEAHEETHAKLEGKGSGKKKG